ncbi:MAG: response regulator [Deltaproteobacteria bacterium]|nr:response regulator [Deltaproteobacteria bacterium]
MSVLIIDDEPEILQTVKNFLELNDIEVETCLSAKEALEKMRFKIYPVIVTDVRMPEMTGVEMVKEIKKTFPTAIIYIMTGFASMENLVECLELGAVDYFVKPFRDMDFIVNSIKEALDRSSRWKKDLVVAGRSKL